MDPPMVDGLSFGPPTMAVSPLEDSATEAPSKAPRIGPVGPVPSGSLACWVQAPPLLRVYTHAAPMLLLSPGPPTMAVSPLEDSATEEPCWEDPIAPVPTGSFCWVQTPPLRVYTHAAPRSLLADRPPTTAVLPAEAAPTESPG